MSEQDEEVTPVLFRKFPKRRVKDAFGHFAFEGGDVIAIFPTQPGTNESWTCGSFQHVGQHGSASRDLVNRTKKAKPEEYADLKRELESAPYGYRLKIYSRWQPSFDVARRAELARV